MLLLPVVITLASLIVAELAQANSVANRCGLNLDDLTTRSQLNDLAMATMSAEALVACPPETQIMITELRKLLHDSDLNVCTLETARRFKDYYLEYIDKSLDKNKKVPKGFKRFALAIGMQMSNACKNNALKVIMSDERNLFNQEDLARLGVWVGESGTLGQLLSRLNGVGETMMPTDLAALLSRNDSVVVEKMYIQSKATQPIRRLKETCEKRFQPIYEPLILPITTLASIGFDFRDEGLKLEFKKQETREAMAKWSNIVFLCEALKFVEPVDYLLTKPAEPITDVVDGSENGLEKSDDSEADSLRQQSNQVADDHNTNAALDKGQLRLVTKEEAEEINHQLQIDPSLRQLLDEESLDELEPVKFEAEFQVRLGNVIVDQADRKLMKAVNSFNRNKSNIDRVKGKLVRQAMLTIRAMLKDRQVVVLATAAAKATWRRMTTRKSKMDQADINKLLVTTVEEMADVAVKKESQMNVLTFVIVLICSLAALALTTWAIWAAVAAALAVGASLSGR